MLDRKDLYRYQNTAIEFVKARENCALWIDVGLGKTPITLTAFADMHRSFDVRRALVVGPLRVARKVWSDEINTWSHLQGISISKITGTPQERMKALRTPADIHTVNFENLEWLAAQFIQDKKQILRWPWDLAILDESQGFKSQSSIRWKTMKKLRRLIPRMTQLTATPSPNGYKNLWSQAYLLDGGQRLGATEEAYEDRWFARTGYGEFQALTLRDTAAAEIKDAMRDIVMALKEEDYLDLPPVISLFHKVQLSGAAMRTYRDMARKFTTEIKGKTLTAVNAGVLDNKLLQLANGVVYTGEGREYVEFHDEKLEFLAELLDSASGKLVVVYYYQHDLLRIKRILERSGRTWGAPRSDSDFSAWAAGAWDAAVLHPKSAGHGLNDVYKAGAEDIVHFGETADLELYQQVNGRLTGGHRRQGRNIKVHHIIAEGTRDEDYVKLRQDKAVSQDDLTRSLALHVSAS